MCSILKSLKSSEYMYYFKYIVGAASSYRLQKQVFVLKRLYITYPIYCDFLKKICTLNYFFFKYRCAISHYGPVNVTSSEYRN